MVVHISERDAIGATIQLYFDEGRQLEQQRVEDLGNLGPGRSDGVHRCDRTNDSRIVGGQLDVGRVERWHHGWNWDPCIHRRDDEPAVSRDRLRRGESQWCPARCDDVPTPVVRWRRDDGDRVRARDLRVRHPGLQPDDGRAAPHRRLLRRVRLQIREGFVSRGALVAVARVSRPRESVVSSRAQRFCFRCSCCRACLALASSTRRSSSGRSL